MKGKDMKRTTALMAAAVLLCGMTGCKGKSTDSSTADTPADTTSAAASENTDSTEEGTAEATAPAESGTKEADSSTADTSDTKKAKDDKGSTTTTAVGSGGEKAVFEYNSDGAVSFNEPAEEQSDDELIEAGQALFRSACETDWSFTVGSPYELNMNKYLENQFGWKFYLVTTPGRNSIADVEKDYYKVFSDRYPTALSEVFMEDGSHVYALNGERGINNYYQYSQITEITSRTKDEVFFNVRNYYDDSAYGGPGPYEQDEEFSAVIGSDGVWKAGKFRLPY